MKIITRLSQKTLHHAADQRGMTLIDVCIALTVVALIVYPLVKEYERYVADATYQKINETLASANAAIEKFYFKEGRYPCPADIELAPGDPNYGLELYNPDEVMGRYCFDPISGENIDDQLAIAQGMVPFKTLGLPEEGAYDPWRYRLTYAVTANMASDFFDKEAYRNGDPANPADPGQPHIYVDGMSAPFVDDYFSDVLYEAGSFVSYAGDTYQALSDTMGNDPPNATYWQIFDDTLVGSTNDQVHYIIISHGPNGIGAYNESGSVTVPCGEATERESMNCDGDDLFFDRGRYDVGGAYGFSEAGGSTYLDDYAFFRGKDPYIRPAAAASGLPGDAMTWSPEDPDDGNVRTKFSKIGIGYDNPDDALDVNGDIRVTSGDVMSGELCDQNDANCFFTHVITGSTNVDGEEVGYIWCEKGAGFASAIQGSDATCDPASVDYFSGFEGSCPGGQVMTGIVGGVIQCTASPL